MSALSTMHSPGKTSRSAGILGRAFAVWLVLMGVGTIHGILRTVFLAPYLGDFRARQVSVFSGSFLIMCTTYLLIRWIPTVKTESLLAVGLFWVALTVVFEMVLGRFVFGRSWETLRSDYDVLHGGLLPIGLTALAFSPLLAARLRRARESGPRPSQSHRPRKNPNVSDSDVIT